MATATYSDLQTLLNMTVTPATCEAIMDHAIDVLNNHGKGALDIPNMTGTAGSKTWSGTSAEKGAIMELACDMYHDKYVTSGASSSSVGIGGLQVSSSTNTGSSATDQKAEQLARNLIEVESEVA